MGTFFIINNVNNNALHTPKNHSCHATHDRGRGYALAATWYIDRQLGWVNQQIISHNYPFFWRDQKNYWVCAWLPRVYLAPVVPRKHPAVQLDPRNLRLRAYQAHQWRPRDAWRAAGSGHITRQHGLFLRWFNLRRCGHAVRVLLSVMHGSHSFADQLKLLPAQKTLRCRN